jgi:hypothetical protein
LGSASNSSASRRSSSSFAPRRRVPASGRTVTCRSTAHNFGRAADERYLGRPQKEHERARIDNSQRPIDFQRIAAEIEFQPLTEHHLKNVAGPDEFDALANCVFVLQLGLIRLPSNPRLACRGDVRGGQVRRLRESRHQFVDPTAGVVVGGLHVPLRLVEPGHHDDEQRLAHVVEHDHPVVERKRQIGQPAVVGRRIRKVLDIPHHVVSRVADCTPLKRRQLGQSHGLISRQLPPQLIERIGRVKLFVPRLAADRDARAVSGKLLERLEGEKAVPAHLFPADDTLEKARMTACVEQVKRGHRRQRIR